MTGRVAVVGAGLMGSGIAQVAAQAGWDVVLRDISDVAVQKGLSAIQRSLDKFVSKGTLDADAAGRAVERITTTTDLDAISDVDIVVEAVFEDLDIKTALFGDLDRLARADAVLATNTSAIPITAIAAATNRPESVVGLHFFSPVPLMKLCELVRGHKTSDQTVRSGKDFAESVGKTCVVVNRDIAGFVTTRLLTAFVMEAIRLVESGVATPEHIDTACQLGFNHRMGPLATCDLTGGDILRNATKAIFAETGDPKFLPPELLNRMVAAGDLGRKSGHGFYDYSERGKS